MTAPEISGTVKLSSIRSGSSSVTVAKKAPVMPTIGLIENRVVSRQTTKQAALPSKLLFPMSLVRPHLLPTSAAAVSPRVMKRMQVIAIDLSKIRIQRKMLVR